MPTTKTYRTKCKKRKAWCSIAIAQLSTQVDVTLQQFANAVFKGKAPPMRLKKAANALVSDQVHNVKDAKQALELVGDLGEKDDSLLVEDLEEELERNARRVCRKITARVINSDHNVKDASQAPVDRTDVCWFDKSIDEFDFERTDNTDLKIKSEEDSKVCVAAKKPKKSKKQKKPNCTTNENKTGLCLGYFV